MKTNLLPSLILGVALLSSCLTSSAQTTPNASFQAVCYPIHHSPKCRLIYVNSEAKPVTITIRNAYGVKYYDETIRGLANFNRIFDLSQLSDGTYRLEVREGKSLFSQTVLVETNQSRSVAIREVPSRDARLETSPVLASTQKP